MDILTEPIDRGSEHPQLIAGCLAKRAMHYLLLGRLDDSLADLAKLLTITGASVLQREVDGSHVSNKQCAVAAGDSLHLPRA